MKTSTKITMGVIILFILIILFVSINKSGSSSARIGPLRSTHEHIAFQTYLDGQYLSFAKPQYMVKNQAAHIEGMDGEVIHKHATGVTMDYFLETLGFSLNNNCLITDNKVKYCNGDGKSLSFYVNGNLNKDFEGYNIRNKDRILISFGDQNNDIDSQLKSLNKIKIE